MLKSVQAITQQNFRRSRLQAKVTKPANVAIPANTRFESAKCQFISTKPGTASDELIMTKESSSSSGDSICFLSTSQRITVRM